MRVMVLGGTRFIGAAVVEELHANGHELLVVHRGEHEPADLPEVDPESLRLVSRVNGGGRGPWPPFSLGQPLHDPSAKLVDRAEQAAEIRIKSRTSNQFATIGPGRSSSARAASCARSSRLGSFTCGTSRNIGTLT